MPEDLVFVALVDEELVPLVGRIRKDHGLGDVHVNKPIGAVRAVPDKDEEELRRWWLDAGNDPVWEEEDKDPVKKEWDESLHPRDERGRFGEGSSDPSTGTGTAVKDPFGIFRDDSAKAHVADKLSDGKFHTTAELRQHAAEAGGTGAAQQAVYYTLRDLKDKDFQLEYQGKSVRIVADPQGKPIGGGVRPEPGPPAPPAPKPEPEPTPRSPGEGITNKFEMHETTREVAVRTMELLRARHPDVVELLGRMPRKLDAIQFPQNFKYPGAIDNPESVMGYYNYPTRTVVVNSRETHSQYETTQRDKLGRPLDTSRPPPVTWPPQGQLVGPENFYTNTHNSGFGRDTTVADRHLAVLIHEIGHHIDYQMIDGMKGGYALVGKAHRNAETTGRYVSQYSKVNKREYFAEAFTAYHVDRARLKEIDPKGHDMIRSVMKRGKKA